MRCIYISETECVVIIRIKFVIDVADILISISVVEYYTTNQRFCFASNVEAKLLSKGVCVVLLCNDVNDLPYISHVFTHLLNCLQR